MKSNIWDCYLFAIQILNWTSLCQHFEQPAMEWIEVYFIQVLFFSTHVTYFTSVFPFSATSYFLSNTFDMFSNYLPCRFRLFSVDGQFILTCYWSDIVWEAVASEQIQHYMTHHECLSCLHLLLHFRTVTLSSKLQWPSWDCNATWRWPLAVCGRAKDSYLRLLHVNSTY